MSNVLLVSFFFNDTATTEIYTLSLHDALPIYMMDVSGSMTDEQKEIVRIEAFWIDTWLKAHYKGIENVYIIHDAEAHEEIGRSTRLNSSHANISYAVFCLKKKTTNI